MCNALTHGLDFCHSPHQIALARRTCSNMHRFIRLPHMQRCGIGVGVDRDCADPHGAGGADDPAGDFAAVGNQE